MPGEKVLLAFLTDETVYELSLKKKWMYFRRWTNTWNERVLNCPLKIGYFPIKRQWFFETRQFWILNNTTEQI